MTPDKPYFYQSRTARLYRILDRLLARLDLYEGEGGICPLYLRDRLDRVEGAVRTSSKQEER